MKNLVQQGAGAGGRASGRRGPRAAEARRPQEPGGRWDHSRNILHYTNVRTNDSTQSLSLT